MLSYESLYTESSEWLEQKQKIVSIEERIKELKRMSKEEQKPIDSRRLSGYHLALGKAYDKLESIEREIRDQYNLKALTFVSIEPVDDDYYEHLLQVDGFIRGIKL